MKIFISIASYQDPLLETTVQSAYENADQPNDLTFAICDQSSNQLELNQFQFNSQIIYHHIDPLLSEGPCWARSIIQRDYNDEDYYLQIDSHMIFHKGWDTYLKSYIKKIKDVGTIGHKKPIITAYPRGFEILDYENKNFVLHDEDKNTHTIAFREDSMFMKGNFCRQIGAITNTEITHGYLVAAGFIFTTKEFVSEVPYDPNFYFYGEEISLMLRAFTRGFGIFHIKEAPIFHLYTDVSNIRRRLHWDEEEDLLREVKWYEREEKSIERLTKIINNEIKGEYGLGNLRTLKDYENLSGVDLLNKIIVNKEKAFTAKYIESLSWNEPIYEN